MTTNEARELLAACKRQRDVWRIGGVPPSPEAVAQVEREEAAARAVLMREHEEHASQCDGACFDAPPADPVAELLRALDAAVAAFPQAWWPDPGEPCDVMATMYPGAPRGWREDEEVAECRDPAVAALLIATRAGIPALVAQRDREHAARVAAEAEAVGLRRDLVAVSRARDVALADVAAERDLYRAALADAARGMVSYCGECERFATLRADEHDREFFACDEHRGEYEWTDTPHAAAIRRSLKATEGER